MMKVRATATGYYNNKRMREGEVFQLEDDSHFSERWMEETDENLVQGTARARPSRVQQAPDARDLHRSIDDTLGDEKVQYSKGTRSMRKPAPVASQDQDEQQSEPAQSDEGPSKTSRAKRGLKNLISGDSSDDQKGKDVI